MKSEVDNQTLIEPIWDLFQNLYKELEEDLLKEKHGDWVQRYSNRI